MNANIDVDENLEYIDVRYDDNTDIPITLPATIANSNANIHLDRNLESGNATHDHTDDISIALVDTIDESYIPPIDLNVIIIKNTNILGDVLNTPDNQ